MIRPQRLQSLLRRLIAIDSQNPPGDEAAIARFVRQHLAGFGVRSHVYEFKKNRPNVVACMGSGKKDRSLLITPHLDTVPAGTGWKTDPFTATVKGGRLVGLGATDCKGNLAVALEAMQSLAEDRAALGYPLIFAATANEESGSEFGLIDLLRRRVLDPGAALVLDADEFEIVVAQKGLLHVKIIVTGKRAHGAYPWLGSNAIEAMLAVLTDLRAARLPFRKNRLLRAPTMNIGTIRGGDKVNVVADRCECELDFRFLPGMRAADLAHLVRRACRSHARRSTIEIEGIQKPYTIDLDHPLVTGLQEAARWAGKRPRITGSEGATVITFFQDRGIPAVATGYGAEGQAHCVNEYALVEHLGTGARILERFLRRWGQPRAAGSDFSRRRP